MANLIIRHIKGAQNGIASYIMTPNQSITRWVSLDQRVKYDDKLFRQLFGIDQINPADGYLMGLSACFNETAHIYEIGDPKNEYIHKESNNLIIMTESETNAFITDPSSSTVLSSNTDLEMMRRHRDLMKIADLASSYLNKSVASKL